MMLPLRRRILRRSPVFISVLGLLAGASAWASVPPGQSPLSQKIRVRLAEAIPEVSLRGYDLRIHDHSSGQAGEPTRRLAARMDQITEWELRCQNGRIRARQVGTQNALDLKEPVMVETPAGFVSFKQKPYRETLWIHSVGSRCEVVNEVDVEKYLDGLVNSEFSAKWNEEAIAAQVIAARTYAYFQIQQARRNPATRYDVDASVRDQVYDGSIKEDFRASRTVDRTRGMVLTTANGPRSFQPLKAFYHSTCGGVTELPERVWGTGYPGFKRKVACSFCARSPSLKWQLDLQPKEVSSAILKGAQADGPQKGWPAGWARIVREGRLMDIRAARSVSDVRIPSVITVWSVGNVTRELAIAGPRFRNWIGFAKFRSTSFNVSLSRSAQGTSWHFEGRGNGHGVGMCQWGAKVMGEKGHPALAILKHYYPDAQIRKLW